MLAGRWDEDKESDQEILSILAGEPYPSYVQKLYKWKNVQDAPVYQVGSTWRIASSLDAWTLTARYLTNQDFQNLKKCLLSVLGEVKPSLELAPESRKMASLYGKTLNHSGLLREGLAQSLILVAIYGSELGIQIRPTAQMWVDSVIRDLLTDASAWLWCSLDDVMPLIAEASPDSFLTQIEAVLGKDNSIISAMFTEAEGIFAPITYYTGLLWALENLAWMPEYLSRVTLILGRLAAVDPGGKISNRPINSLRHIFLAWNPQTLANLEHRLVALSLLAKREPDIAWKLFLMLLPTYHDIGHPTHKMRWRLFSENLSFKVTYQAVWDTHSALLKSLLALAGNDEHKIAQLIDAIDTLSFQNRGKVLSFVDQQCAVIEQKQHLIWHQLRIVLHGQNSRRNSERDLTPEELSNLEKLFKKYMPTDVVQQHIWMFNEHWPRFADGFNRDELGHEEQMHLIWKKRRDGFLSILNHIGIRQTIELIDQVTEPGIFGRTAGRVVTDNTDTILFLNQLCEESEKRRFAAKEFIYQQSFSQGLAWVKKNFYILQENGFSDEQLAKFLCPVNQSRELWDFIDSTNKEIIEAYWQNCLPWFHQLPITDSTLR